ncbi:MAG: SDR family NAD(P)-dependent oxidoreductase, partial [Gammaproteobacteria bacterium]
QVASEGGRDAGSLHPFPVDVTDLPAMAATAARIEAQLGPLDCAVFNAGDYRPMPLEAFDPGLFRQLMEVNYLGVVHGISAVLDSMRARRTGSIWVNASVSGYRGLPRAAPYGATKAALINLAESLQPELAAAGIAIHVINPGFVKTALTARNAFPMPFLISPEQAARAIMAGMGRSRFEVVFPWRMAVLMKLLRCLPYRWYFGLTRRMVGS